MKHQWASSTEAEGDPEVDPPAQVAKLWRRRAPRLNSTTADNHKKQAPQAVFRLEPNSRSRFILNPTRWLYKDWAFNYVTALANWIPGLTYFKVSACSGRIMNYSLLDVISDTTVSSR